MKSLAADILALFKVFGGGHPRILVEIAATGGTKYYSDQYLMVGTQSYEGRILSWGRMSMETALGEDFIREGRIPIKLSNQTPKISDDIDPGDAVSIYIWDTEAAAGSKFKIFEGTVNDDIIAGYDEFSFTCTDVSAKYNLLIGTKLDISTYPDADPNDIGKIQPIPYGSNKNSRCLAIEAGAASTLRDDRDAVQTVIKVTDVSRFPTSGQGIIGEEEISWTGKTTGPDSLTGVTRGINATSHAHGDAIFEKVATVKYMASGRIAKAITNAAIVPWGAPLEEKVLVDDFATYNVNDSGIGTIELNSLPQLKRLVDIAVTQQPDQPVTSEGTHIHTATVNDASQVTLFGDGVASSQNASNTGNAFDQNEGTSALLEENSAPNAAHLGLDFNYAAFDGLEIAEAVAAVRHAAGANMDTYNLVLASKSFTQALDQSDTNPKTQKFIVSALNGETDWSDLDGLKVDCVDSDSIVQSNVFELWWEIKYIPTVTIATHAADNISTSPRTTNAIIGGDSVAANLGGFLVCDIDGEPDVAGHWTGSGTDLIEKPVDIIHHILETFTNGPVAHADIDLAGSFADAETTHSNMDVWGFVITQQIWVNELLTYLAQQFFCRFIWEAGIAKLNRIKIVAAGIPDKEIETEFDSITKNNKLTVKEDRWGKDRVWNDITVNFDLDLILSQGNWFSEDNYLQNTQDDDATSISANGRQSRVFNAFAIGDNSTYADDLRDKLLSFYKVNRKYISLLSWSTLLELERGDEIDLTTPQLDLSDFDCEIVNIEIDFPRRGQSIIPIITLLEV
jgi:hypothetical protein